MLSEDPTETPSKDELSVIVDCVITEGSTASLEGLPSFPDVQLVPDVQHEALMALAVTLRVLESGHPPKLRTHSKQHRGR